MKRLLLGLVLLCAACGTASRRVPLVHPEVRPGSPTAPPASSPLYVFQGVDLFGVRTLPREELLALFSLPAPGTALDPSQPAFIEPLIASKQRLLAAHPWRLCTVSMTQLDTHEMFVTADVVEAGDAWRMPFLPAPEGDVPDPEGLLAAWKDYQTRVWALQREGALPLFGTGACRAQVCHAGFAHPDLAPREPRFVEGVPRQAEALVRVLREDRDASKRYTALFLLPYVTSPEWLLQAVLPSVKDSDSGVRNEALRTLGSIQKGQPRALIPLEPVLEALWFPVTSDRNKAGWALVALVQAEGPARRDLILERSGEALLQMFQMKNALDHEPAHDVLALLAGQDLGEDVAAWRAWLSAARK